ncbi:MAG: NlpC/P60 family protein [Acidobacteriota bacterium]
MKKTSLQDIAEDIQRSLGIDRRFVVFDWQSVEEKPKGLIRFTVSSQYASEGIARYFAEKAHARLCRYEIEKIPKKEDYAIASAGVVQVMAAPTYRSEQVTQMLLGEAADLLQSEGEDWARVRLHADGYIGWVSRNQIAEIELGDMVDWIESVKVTPKRFVIPLYTAADKQSDPAGEFLFGTFLPVLQSDRRFTKLMLPDGTHAFAESSLVKKPARAPKAFSSERIIETARMFLGIPYVWGGRSVKGFDCSGFVQTVFRLNGIELPRDASLQWKTGMDAGRDHARFAEGDLLFFGPSAERITHVAISLGEDLFIHESGNVHCSSLDSRHPLYSKKYASTFQGARRLGMADSD